MTGGRSPNYAGAGGAQDRTAFNLSTRGRANLAMDTRAQTQYGVVRAVASLHFLSSPDLFGGNNGVAIGWITDGVFVNGSSIELTNTWSAQGGYDHFWTPALSTNIFAGYSRVSYNSQAKTYFAGAPQRTGAGAATGATAQTGISLAGLVNDCNPDYSFIEVGSKTTWRPVPDLAISGEIMYNRVFSGFNGSGNLVSAPGARPPGVCTIGDESIWTAFFRIQRNYAAAGDR